MIKVKFLGSIMKGGIMRQRGDLMELPESTAALLADTGMVEIPGKKVIKVKKEVEVLEIVDAKTSK